MFSRIWPQATARPGAKELTYSGTVPKLRCSALPSPAAAPELLAQSRVTTRTWGTGRRPTVWGRGAWKAGYPQLRLDITRHGRVCRALHCTWFFHLTPLLSKGTRKGPQLFGQRITDCNTWSMSASAFTYGCFCKINLCRHTATHLTVLLKMKSSFSWNWKRNLPSPSVSSTLKIQFMGLTCFKIILIFCLAASFPPTL